MWESDNRGGAMAVDAVIACMGCKVARECASHALEFDCRGMVWAGVAVPEMPGTKYHDRALDRLQRIATGQVRPW